MARAKKNATEVKEETRTEEIKTEETNMTVTDAILNAQDNSVDTVEYMGKAIHISKRINVYDMLNFVNKTVEACFSEEGDYMPEAKDFSIRLATLIAYTDLNTDGDIDRQYALCYCEGLIDLVHEHIDKAQLADIIKAIDEKVTYTSSMKLQFIYKQVNEVAASFASVLEKIEGVYEGIGEDDIKALIGSLGNMKIDESKLMRAFVKEKKKK